MKAALDTNCFIDAVQPFSHSYNAMAKVLEAHALHIVDIFVSLHTLHELEEKPDAALDLARHFPTLAYFPIGRIQDQVGTISEISGTFDNMRQNESIQIELASMANAGTDIRDRGALIDALHASLDLFVTSDSQLVAAGPAARIRERFCMRIIRPGEAAQMLRKGSS